MKDIQYNIVCNANIPRKSVQIKLGKKGDKYTTCTKIPTPATTVNASHPLEPFAWSPRSCFFFPAPFFHLLLDYYFFSFLSYPYNRQTFSLRRSIESYPSNRSFLSLPDFDLFSSFLFSPLLSPRDIQPKHFCSTYLRLIGAVFVFSSDRAVKLSLKTREETIFLIFQSERFLRNSLRDWRFLQVNIFPDRRVVI